MTKDRKILILKICLIPIVYFVIKGLFKSGIVQKYDDFFLYLCVALPFIYDIWAKRKKYFNNM